MNNEINRFSDKFALSEILGLNPRKTKKLIIDHFINKHPDPKIRDSFKNKRFYSAESYFDHLIGDRTVPENVNLSKLGSTVRTLFATSRLYGLLTNAPIDMATSYIMSRMIKVPFVKFITD